MNKYILSLIFLFFVGLNGLYAQCTPDTSFKVDGYYPDSLPHDTVGKVYATVIQVKVTKDTTFEGFPATIDTLMLDTIIGLPGGFTYGTNPSNKIFLGDSNACILLSGAAPNSGMIGSYPLKIYITLYGKATIFSQLTYLSVPDSVTSYTIHIDPAITGISNFSQTKFDLSQNFPDPASGLTNIYYNVAMPSRLDFKVYNLLGTIVYQKSFFADRGNGAITLDAANFAPGIYMYNLSNGKTTLTKRMVMTSN